MIDFVTDQRILQGAPASLSATLYDQNGEVDATVDSGVTVTVTRLDGTAIATAAAATTTANGVATYTLTAAQTALTLDVLTAAWTTGGSVRATTKHEIVGRFWFPPSRLMAMRGVSPALGAMPGDNTMAAIIAARTWVETLIEEATGVAWVPRTALDYLSSSGRTSLPLRNVRPRSLVSIVVGGVAETVGDYVADEGGTLRRSDGGSLPSSDAREFVVRYSHGYDAPPQDLLDAALVAAADRFMAERTSTQSSRATTYADGSGGFTTLAPVSVENPTGIREVDRTIRAYSHRIPGVA